jgi:acyl-[acyl carrier protein]--UDP-N-acetylglucosamine O-acyltransferase
VLIGGHSLLGYSVNMGLGSICHQFSKIGAYSMIGMNSTVPKNTKVLPGYIYVGSPIRLLKKNTVVLLRNNVTDFDLENLLKAYNND